MATYTDASVGYGSNYTVDMKDPQYTDMYWWPGWTGEFYVGGYVLYISRTDRVNGMTVDKDWETLGDTETDYIAETDEENDLLYTGSVVFAKDGASINDISIERGLFMVNAPVGDNTDDQRWTTTVNGLDVNGEFAIVAAFADSTLKNVTVSNGAFYSSSENLVDLTVSDLGKVALFTGSTTHSLVIKGGFVQADAGAYIEEAIVVGGELTIDADAAVDTVEVRDGGILITTGSTSVTEGLIGKGGIIYVGGNANSSLMDFSFEAGARISIGSGVYSTERAIGLRFDSGVIVGYGFNNANLGYFVGNTYYSVSATESKNFVAVGETVQMHDGMNAYNLTIEDGGALYAEGGKIEGLNIQMNYAILDGKATASDVQLESPDLLDSHSTLQLDEEASVTKLRAYDDSLVKVFGKNKLTTVTLNDKSECYFGTESAAEMGIVTVNDASHVTILGSSIVKNMTLNSGVVEVAYNGKIENLMMNGGAVHSWDGNNTLVNINQYGGTIAVQGSVNGITVYEGGRLTQVGDPESSGRISNMTLKDGAWLAINNIATINGSFDPSKITVGYDFNSGYQVNGYESYKYIVSFYNQYFVNKNYTAKDMCISVGNSYVEICNGGKMINGDIENGCLTVEGGAVLSGKINLYGETYYMDDGYGYHEASGIHFLSDEAFVENATFNFVLGTNKQLEDYKSTDDMSLLGLNFDAWYGDGEEMFDLALTIDSDLKLGETYSMYLGSGFKMEDVDVYDKYGNALGTVRANQVLEAGGKRISLVNLNTTTNQIYERQWAVYVEATQRSGIEADIDGNGLADVLMSISRNTHPSYGATGAWLIQEDQGARWGNLSTLKKDAVILGIGTTDLSKDTDDIFVRDGNTVGAWITDANGGVSGWQSIMQLNNADVIGLGDFNGAGKTDLLLRTTSGDIGCYFTDGAKSGWNYFQSVGKEWEVSAVGDFNGDGRCDLALEHAAGFAGCWLTNANGSVSWSSLDNLNDGLKIVGAGDFNNDGTDDILLQKGNYFGAWIIKNGNATDWMGLGSSNGTVEQIEDFNGDGVDDIRLRTDRGDIGVLLVNGEDSMTWNYYGSVGSEWNTALAAL